MNPPAGNPLEEDIEIDAALAAATCLGYPGNNIDEGIHKILQVLSLRVNGTPGKRNYVAARSTLYNWRDGKVPASPPSTRRGVVAAVYRLTGIDISLGSALTRSPLNLSDLALLFPVEVKRISNQPEASGAETYQITVPFLRLWAAEMDVTSEWWRTPAPGTPTKPTTLGRIRFSVPQAELNVSNLEEKAATPLLELRPGAADQPGKIEGGVLIYNGGNSWQLVMQEADFKPAVVVTGATLGTIKAKVGTAVTFEIGAKESHIRTDFQLTAGVSEVHGPRGDTIERLMSVILAKRRAGMGTLAVHVVDTK